MGKLIEHVSDTVNPPRMKYAFLMHYSFRTAEERVEKIKKGFPCNRPDNDIEGSLQFYFTFNKLTEEKLRVFEKGFNTTFPSLRRKLLNNIE